MSEIVIFLEKWQTLLGSIIGGIIALFVALIVAHSLRRREEVASAMLLLSDITEVRIAFEVLRDLAVEKKIPDNEYPLWLAEKLAGSFPKLSPLFENAVVRMLPINAVLAAHLTLFHKIYTGVEINVKRIQEDFRLFNEKGKPNRSKDHFKADANLINKHFPLAVQHATCAGSLISDLILSKTPTFKILRRRFWQTPEEKECMKRLKKG